jgi:hypothetical protein
MFAVEFVQTETVLETVTANDGSTSVRETTREVRVRASLIVIAHSAPS